MEKLIALPKRKHRVTRMIPKGYSIIKFFGKKYLMKDSVKDIYATLGNFLGLALIFAEIYAMYLILYLYM